VGYAGFRSAGAASKRVGCVTTFGSRPHASGRDRTVRRGACPVPRLCHVEKSDQLTWIGGNICPRVQSRTIPKQEGRQRSSLHPQATQSRHKSQLWRPSPRSSWASRPPPPRRRPALATQHLSHFLLVQCRPRLCGCPVARAPATSPAPPPQTTTHPPPPHRCRRGVRLG